MYADDTNPAFVASPSSVSAINEVINVFLLWIVWFRLVFLFASCIMDRK